jgi:hypothetical protein
MEVHAANHIEPAGVHEETERRSEPWGDVERLLLAVAGVEVPANVDRQPG